MSRCSRHTKSTVYGPIGSWRTNLYPRSARARRRCHRRSSALVELCRSALARLVFLKLAPRIVAMPPHPALRADLSPQAGRGKTRAMEQRHVIQITRHVTDQHVGSTSHHGTSPLPACGERSISSAARNRVRGRFHRPCKVENSSTHFGEAPSPARFARDLSPQAGRGRARATPDRPARVMDHSYLNAGTTCWPKRRMELRTSSAGMCPIS